MPKKRLDDRFDHPAGPPSGPARQAALMSKREAWVRQIAPEFLFYRLFDLIPGTYFFAKNREGEIMFHNRAALRDIFHSTSERLGFTDFDLNPAGLAKSYVEDDARIYASGEPLVNRVELWFDGLGLPTWFVTNKMPIRSRTGEIIGIMGFGQTYDERAKLLPPGDGIAKVVACIRQDYRVGVSIRDMARLSGMSQRQLERRFKDHFGVTPQQFLIRTRVMAACEQLFKTDHSVAEIAQACGFADQSAFGRVFRRNIGLTPSQFRHSRKMR